MKQVDERSAAGKRFGGEPPAEAGRQFDLGPTDRLEFDLYYDLPVDAKPTALKVFGGPSLADFSDANGVDAPIRTSS